MPTIVVETKIDASVAVVFDLARDIQIHCQTASSTQERAIEGVTDGLIGLGESVTFEAVHFGIRQRLTARVVEFDYPNKFVDEMLAGAFKTMRHIHEFSPSDNGTLMVDTLIWTSPMGVLGTLTDKLFLERHMRGFLEIRNKALKRIAESRITPGD